MNEKKEIMDEDRMKCGWLVYFLWMRINVEGKDRIYFIWVLKKWVCWYFMFVFVVVDVVRFKWKFCLCVWYCGGDGGFDMSEVFFF